jgi:D-sedoheptulose 7-phosphate isomerase
VKEALKRHRELLDTLEAELPAVGEMIDFLWSVLEAGRKILIAGNGGSAADAQHFASELSGRFKLDRKAIPAVALTTDTSALTAIGNDLGFEQVFARQVEALGSKGDALVLISTSGNSVNLLKAKEAADKAGVGVCALLGGDGGALGSVVEKKIVVSHRGSDRVQEMHILVIHLLCEELEKRWVGIHS